MNEIKEILINLTSLELAIFTITFLIIVMVLLIIYIISSYVEVTPKTGEKKVAFNLENVTKILAEENKKPRELLTGTYEIEQEENAIISYEELLEQTTKIDLNSFEDMNILKEEENQELKAPISYEDFKKLETEENFEVTKEIGYLKDLKTFRAGLK